MEEIFTCGECGKQFKVYIVFCEHELECNGFQEVDKTIKINGGF